MTLPTNPKTPWPPATMAPVLDEIRRLDAWYSGRWERIRAVTAPNDLQSAMRAARSQSVTNNSENQLVVPVAGDIARTSADLLFSETPAFTTDDPAAQDRLDQLLELCGFESMLLEAAELCAATTGIYWRVGWDTSLVRDRPILSFVQQDHAIPEWRWGILTAVTFWSELARLPGQSDGFVWRHLERHSSSVTGAVVEHGLYFGTSSELGQSMPLIDHPDTAAIAAALTPLPDGNGQSITLSGVPMTAGYVPNMRPNRRDRGSMLGRADIDGQFGILRGINDTWTSWMRDLRLAKARLIVPQSYLDPVGPGKGAMFDVDRELFEAANIMPPKDGGTALSLVQFAIRVDEHERTIKNLIQQVVTSAGYSLQSFGLAGEVAATTATEIRSRERLSMITRERKTRYWNSGLREMLFCLLAVDQFMGNTDAATPSPVMIEFGDSVSEDPKVTAETAGLLFQAQAATIETRVRMVHPDWDEARVAAEVVGIMAESGVGPVENPDPGEDMPNGMPPGGMPGGVGAAG